MFSVSSCRDFRIENDSWIFFLKPNFFFLRKIFSFLWKWTHIDNGCIRNFNLISLVHDVNAWWRINRNTIRALQKQLNSLSEIYKNVYVNVAQKPIRLAGTSFLYQQIVLFYRLFIRVCFRDVRYNERLVCVCVFFFHLYSKRARKALCCIFNASSVYQMKNRLKKVTFCARKSATIWTVSHTHSPTQLYWFPFAHTFFIWQRFVVGCAMIWNFCIRRINALYRITIDHTCVLCRYLFQLKYVPTQGIAFIYK